MSDRHTKGPPWIGPMYDGLAFVPSMGFVGSIMPPGRHRINWLTHWIWFGTGRLSSLGTEICTPVRMNGHPR